jgi:hypothetical protein
LVIYFVYIRLYIFSFYVLYLGHLNKFIVIIIFKERHCVLFYKIRIAKCFFAKLVVIYSVKKIYEVFFQILLVIHVGYIVFFSSLENWHFLNLLVLEHLPSYYYLPLWLRITDSLFFLLFTFSTSLW